MQWVLTYMQREVADVWEKNVMENLEIKILEFETVEKFLEVIKK